MSNVISMAAYKAKKGIVSPRSKYYTTNATKEQIREAVEYAQSQFDTPCDYRGKPPYAVVIGYEDNRGHIRLLKNQIIFTTKKSFQEMGKMATLNTVAIIHDNGL